MDTRNVGVLIVETSFPNRMEQIALQSGHLTPALLGKEIAKMKSPPPRIFLIHAKPQHLQEIEREVPELGRGEIRFLIKGAVLRI